MSNVLSVNTRILKTLEILTQRLFGVSVRNITLTNLEELCLREGFTFAWLLSVCSSLSIYVLPLRPCTLGDVQDMHERIRKERGLSKNKVSRRMGMDRCNYLRFMKSSSQQTTNVYRFFDLCTSVDVPADVFMKKVEENIKTGGEDQSE